VIALISLVLFFWPAALIYLAATFLLKEKPLIYAGRRHESEFWRSRYRHDRWSHS
jgi:hypothetical protein